MPTHMDRLQALVNIRNYVDKHVDMDHDVEVLPGLTIGDLRDVVMPTHTGGIDS